MSCYAGLRRVCRSYAEGKTLRTPCLSGLAGCCYASYAEISYFLTRLERSVCIYTRVYALSLGGRIKNLLTLRNLRNSSPYHPICAPILSAFRTVTMSFFFCVTNKEITKRRVTDSNQRKERERERALSKRGCL